tara:strand:- start:345 stop:533 length:189 start_codon:yes stop_codon:yes gene_type:complete
MSCKNGAFDALALPLLAWQMLPPEDWTDAWSFARNHGIVLRGMPYAKELVPSFTSLEILLSQ